MYRALIRFGRYSSLLGVLLQSFYIDSNGSGITLAAAYIQKHFKDDLKLKTNANSHRDDVELPSRSTRAGVSLRNSPRQPQRGGEAAHHPQPGRTLANPNSRAAAAVAAGGSARQEKEEEEGEC